MASTSATSTSVSYSAAPSLSCARSAASACACSNHAALPRMCAGPLRRCQATRRAACGVSARRCAAVGSTSSERPPSAAKSASSAVRCAACIGKVTNTRTRRPLALASRLYAGTQSASGGARQRLHSCSSHLSGFTAGMPSKRDVLACQKSRATSLGPTGVRPAAAIEEGAQKTPLHRAHLACHVTRPWWACAAAVPRRRATPSRRAARAHTSASAPRACARPSASSPP